MAEERLVDDDLNKGLKLRKTEEGAEEESGEFSFEFPMMDEEDDEELAGLTPEEALALRKQKAEAAQRRKEDYEKLLKEGEALLEQKQYESAEQVFEKALDLDDPATTASVGYWRAKTADFENPDVLIDEYLEAGIESLEYDLGYEATEIVREQFKPQFEKRLQEYKAEEAPLTENVEGKQVKRREILTERKKKALKGFLFSAAPLLVFVLLTAFFGLKITSTPDGRFILPTVIFGVLSAIAFVPFLLLTNKYINACRIFNKNEKLTATEEGERLVEVREYIELYEAFLYPPVVEEEPAMTEENTEESEE